MWDTIMAVNSFVVWPLTLIFLMYATARTLLFFEWKMLVVAIILFLIATGAEIVFAIMAD